MSHFDDGKEFAFGEEAGAHNQFFTKGRSGGFGADETMKNMQDFERKQKDGLLELRQGQFDDNLLPSEKRDKMRLGGNFLNVREDHEPEFSGFNVLVSGHIESGQVDEFDGLCSKYDFIAGTDWNIVEGNRTGVSQHAYKSQQTNRKVVWNYPFEIAFRANNVSGWPQIVLTVTNRDFLGRDQVCGYGTVHVPTQPGTHTRYINLFRPVSSSLISQVLGFFNGKNAEYVSPTELLSKNDGREVTRVQSGGTVKIQFHVTMKNMDSFGIFPFKA